MGPEEEPQVQVEYGIQQEEPASKGKQALIAFGSVAFIFFLPTLFELVSGEKPWRF